MLTMTKTTLKLALVAIGMSVAPFWTTGAHAASEGAAGQAVVLQPLQLVNLTDLRFGRIIPSAVAGNVVINPNTNARSSTNGIVLVGPASDVGAAEYVTYGGPLQYLWVTRGPFPVLRRQGTGVQPTMTMTSMILDGPVYRYLNAAGVVPLKVGGTLRVGANQPTGHYSGTYNITVTYF